MLNKRDGDKTTHDDGELMGEKAKTRLDCKVTLEAQHFYSLYATLITIYIQKRLKATKLP